MYACILKQAYVKLLLVCQTLQLTVAIKWQNKVLLGMVVMWFSLRHTFLATTTPLKSCHKECGSGSSLFPWWNNKWQRKCTLVIEILNLILHLLQFSTTYCRWCLHTETTITETNLSLTATCLQWNIAAPYQYTRAISNAPLLPTDMTKDTRNRLITNYVHLHKLLQVTRNAQQTGSNSFQHQK